MGLKRKFQAMKIVLHTSNEPYIKETWTDNAIHLLATVTAKHGSHIRRLIFVHADIECAKDFSSILGSMPLLRELTLSRVKFNIEEDFTKDKHFVPSKLNKLTVNTCDWNIFHFFMSSPIKELKIANKFAFVDVKQRAAYVQFLVASTKLESIECDLMAYAKTFQTQMDGNISFKLKRLKYFSFSPSYEFDEIDRNFGTFIESQAASLTELDLNYLSPNTVKTIFTKLKCLVKLRLNAVVLPNDSEFYGSFKQMPNLRELTLHDDIPSEVAAKQILVNCCNLETLTANHDPCDYIPNLLAFLAANTPMLKNLSLDTMSVAVPAEAKFNHLKFLHIQTCSDLPNLTKFLSNNVTIETLSLNFSDDSIVPVDADAYVDVLLNQSNIQHFIVAAADIILNAVYKQINNNSKNLKTLELRPLTTAADKILVAFPKDKSEWQPFSMVNRNGNRPNMFSDIEQLHLR